MQAPTVPYECVRCPTECTPAQVPGPAGTDGTDGTNGSAGANAYTLLIVGFTMPAIGLTVVAEVGSTAWMVAEQSGIPGQALAVEYAGTLLVTNIVDATHVELENPGYTGNAPGGTAIPALARIGVSGIEGPSGATPGGALLAANNLSDLTNVATARGSLGLGTMAQQDANNVNITGGAVAGVTGLLVTDISGAAKSGLSTASGLTVSATDKVLGRSSAGAGAVEEIACTAAGRSVIDDASVTAMRTTLGIQRTPQDLIILRDQKGSGTDGGTFTSGAWQTRDLNTEVVDTGNHCTLAGNQFTLADGTYRIQVKAPAHRVDPHQIRLFDVVAAAVVTEAGILAYGGNADTITTADDITIASLVFRFTVTAGPRAYRIEHRCTTTRATDGFGSANSFGGPEIYTEVWLEREVG